MFKHIQSDVELKKGASHLMPVSHSKLERTTADKQTEFYSFRKRSVTQTHTHTYKVIFHIDRDKETEREAETCELEKRRENKKNVIKSNICHLTS